MAANPTNRPQQQKVPVWNDPQAVPYINIESVTKKFGDFVAVNDVSLKVYRGELFCLLGGSGCGKTTLLRMLAGFEEPTAGRISIDGVDMAGIPPYERPVNMMFQSYALFPHMTVEQNVAFGLKQDGTPKRDIVTRVADMLSLVTLSSRIGVMEAGRIVQTGTPKDIYEYPNCKYVAEFIGNINVFQGTMIEDEPDHMRIATPEMEGTIYVNHGVSAASDAVVWAAVRPEKIQLSIEPPQQQDNVTRGVVKEIAYMGDMSIYLVQTSTGKMMRV